MEREKREVASLTKIMTAYTVFKLMERFGTEETTLITVSPEAAGVIGTSAELLEGDTLQIWQILHGLMLPSGNDAAHALAEFFGGILKKESEETELQLRKEELEKAKLEEERAAQGADEEVEPESNSASIANLQDKETNSSSQETKERGIQKRLKKDGDDLSTQQSTRKLPEKREPFNIKKSPYLVKSS